MSGDGFGTILLLAAGLVGGALYLAGSLAVALTKGVIKAASSAHQYYVRRQREVDLQAGAVSEDLNAAMSSIQRSMNAQLKSSEEAHKQLMSELDQRGEQLKLNIRQSGNDNLQQLRHSIETARINMKSAVRDGEKRITQQYSQSVETAINESSMRLKSSYDAMLRSISALSAQESERKRKAMELAELNIKDAEAAIAVLERNFPGAQANVLIALNKAKSAYNTGNYEAAAQAASDTVLRAMDSLKAELKHRNEADMLRGELIGRAEELKEKMTSLRYMEFDYKGERYNEDLAEFSSGMYAKAQRYLADFSNRLGSGRLEKCSDAELAALKLEADTELEPYIDNMFEYAAENLVNSYQRNEIAEVVEETLNKQGYEYDEMANAANNRGEELAIRFKNVNNEEIVVRLVPTDNEDMGSVGTDINVSMYGLADPTDEKRKAAVYAAINEAIKRELRGSSTLSCDKKTVNMNSQNTEGRDFKRLAEKQPRHADSEG